MMYGWSTYDEWKCSEPPPQEDERDYCPECEHLWDMCKCETEENDMMDQKDWVESFDSKEDEESFRQWLDSLEQEERDEPVEEKKEEAF